MSVDNALARPMYEVAEWKFEGDGWLQGYQNPDRTGNASATLVVSKLTSKLPISERAPSSLLHP